MWPRMYNLSVGIGQDCKTIMSIILQREVGCDGSIRGRHRPLPNESCIEDYLIESDKQSPNPH